MGTKHMCKLKKKDLEKDMKKFQKTVLPPKFVCKNCMRVASDKKYLCKPIALE